MRRVFDAIAAQDLERLLELTDPDVEWESFFALGEAGGVYRGHAGIERYVADLADAWEAVVPVIDDGLEFGALVLAVGRVRYRGRESGVETESPAGWVLRVRDGKVLRFRAFSDPEAALEDVGRLATRDSVRRGCEHVFVYRDASEPAARPSSRSS